MSPPRPADPTIVLKLHVGCRQCGYDLYGLSGDPIRCPECGGENPYQVVLQNWNRIREPKVECTFAALLSGPLLWIGPSWIAGEMEAWDSSWGWAWFLGTLAASGVLGYRAPSLAALWPVLVVGSEYVAMWATADSGPRFLWIGEAIFLAVMLVSMLAAIAGSAFGRLDQHGWHPER